MTEAAQTITERLRQGLERERAARASVALSSARAGGDAAELAARDLGAESEGQLARRIAREQVRRYNEEALAGSAPLIVDEAAAVREAVAAVTGLGPLQPLLDDATVEEIWINAPDRVFIARRGVTEQLPLRLAEEQVRDLVDRMLASTGRRVDLSSPFVDASLPDGSRLHVAIPDITRRHYAVNIRKFDRAIRGLASLVDLGSLPQHAADLLAGEVRRGSTVLVSGATQAGKTTMLGALLDARRPEERVVTVEETFELMPSGRDVVALQCRQPSLEGTGEVSLRRLIKESLRMRPDRLVVGEVREAESLDLLIAINAGLPALCSIHANSARDALRKLCTLPLLAGRNIDPSFVVPTVSHCIQLVVHCELLPDGRRRVVEIAAPEPQEGIEPIRVRTLYSAEEEAEADVDGEEAAPDARDQQAATRDTPEAAA